MADESKEKASERAPSRAATPAEETKQESEAVKTDDERYVGVDPIYKQSAYEEPLEAQAGRGSEDKDAVQAEAEMVERVKANEAGCVVQLDEAEDYEEWLPTSSTATRTASVRGVDEKQVEADKKVTEEAKGDDGKIAPRSGSAQQPGVHTVQ